MNKQINGEELTGSVDWCYADPLLKQFAYGRTLRKLIHVNDPSRRMVGEIGYNREKGMLWVAEILFYVSAKAIKTDVLRKDLWNRL